MSRICLATLVACLMAPAVAAAADGSVHLYLQPFPAAASRLGLTITSISAVNAGGGRYPLALNLKTIRPGDATRQRLLASGRLPVGTYAGFVFKIRQAALKNAQGEAALPVADNPARIDASFAVGGPQPPLLWLTLNYEETAADPLGATPLFTAVAPSRPIVDHLGFVTNSGSNTITVFDKDAAGGCRDRHLRRPCGDGPRPAAAAPVRGVFQGRRDPVD